MAGSFVICTDCGDSSAAVEWGFVLLARHGWAAQLGDAGAEPTWRCPGCNTRLTRGDVWDEKFRAKGLVQAARRRLRVLLVDDQVLVLRATAGMLRELDVVTASSGADALVRLAEGSHFDVVVSDVAMPGINGPELFSRVCALYPHLAERFLLLSGDAHGAAALSAVIAKRDHLERMPPILEKPVPRDMLVREIEELGRRVQPHSGTFAIANGVEEVRAKTK